MQLVEQTVANIEMDPCADGDAARTQPAMTSSSAPWAGWRLCGLRRCIPRRPRTWGMRETDEPERCRYHAEQSRSASGGDRTRMRQWLESLGPVERSVFVLRAVLGRTEQNLSICCARRRATRGPRPTWAGPIVPHYARWQLLGSLRAH